MMTRRDAIRTATGTVVAALTGPTLTSVSALAAEAPPSGAMPSEPGGPFTLPPLPYPPDALEPHIDARTMTIHHDKHHQAYVNNANKALVGHDAFSRLTAEQMLKKLNDAPEAIRTALRNNVGGHYNHSLFWQMMKKDGGGQPSGALAKEITATFGNFDSFRKQFDAAAMKVFGSGWAWLSLNTAKKLVIETTPNQDNPISQGNVPLLGLDVWEHAYYLKYQNLRADYVAAFHHVVNWDFVASRYHIAMG